MCSDAISMFIYWRQIYLKRILRKVGVLQPSFRAHLPRMSVIALQNMCLCIWMLQVIVVYLCWSNLSPNINGLNLLSSFHIRIHVHECCAIAAFLCGMYTEYERLFLFPHAIKCWLNAELGSEWRYQFCANLIRIFMCSGRVMTIGVYCAYRIHVQCK